MVPKSRKTKKLGKESKAKIKKRDGRLPGKTCAVLDSTMYQHLILH
jgi:hypothetical protein